MAATEPVTPRRSRAMGNTELHVQISSVPLDRERAHRLVDGTGHVVPELR